MDLNTYQKTTVILINLQALIGLIGIVGNMLTFCVFLRKPLRKHSYSFYFRIMSWTDTFIIVVTFRHWLRIVLNVDLDLLGPLFCRLNEYQPYLVASTTIWLRNLILFDRVIRVVYPAHFAVIRRKRFQITAVSIIFVSSALLHILIPLNYRLETRIEPSDNLTHLVCYLPPNVLRTNFMLVMVNVSICAICTFIFDFKLISYIFYSRKKLHKKVYNNQHPAIIKDRKFALSSVFISLTNFFFQLIFAASMLTALTLRLNPDQVQLVFIFSLMATSFNFSSVFFVNMSINSIFYNEFFRLSGIKKSKSLSI